MSIQEGTKGGFERFEGMEGKGEDLHTSKALRELIEGGGGCMWHGEDGGKDVIAAGILSLLFGGRPPSSWHFQQQKVTLDEGVQQVFLIPSSRQDRF